MNQRLHYPKVTMKTISMTAKRNFVEEESESAVNEVTTEAAPKQEENGEETNDTESGSEKKNNLLEAKK